MGQPRHNDGCRRTDEDVPGEGDGARRAEAAALKLLQDELAKLAPPGANAVVTDVVVRQGIPVDIVSRVARELDAELVVVGTHARKGLEHALLGSVAERLIRTCPCPVLVARPAAATRSA